MLAAVITLLMTVSGPKRPRDLHSDRDAIAPPCMLSVLEVGAQRGRCCAAGSVLRARVGRGRRCGRGLWLGERGWTEAVRLRRTGEAATGHACAVSSSPGVCVSLPRAAGMDNRRCGAPLGRRASKLVGRFARLTVINKREPLLRPKADERHPNIHPNPPQADARRRPQRPRGSRTAPPADLDGPRIRSPRPPARPQARASLDLPTG